MRRVFFVLCMVMFALHGVNAQSMYKLKAKTFIYQGPGVKYGKVYFSGSYGSDPEQVYVAAKGQIVAGDKVKNGFMHVYECGTWNFFEEGWIKASLLQKMTKCQACHGTGRTNRDCPSCGGAGAHLCCEYTGKVACKKCNGVGAY